MDIGDIEVGSPASKSLRNSFFVVSHQTRNDLLFMVWTLLQYHLPRHKSKLDGKDRIRGAMYIGQRTIFSSWYG